MLSRTFIITAFFGLILLVTPLPDKLRVLKDRAARVITGTGKRKINKLGWLNLKERRNKQKALIMFKIINEMTPVYLNFRRVQEHPSVTSEPPRKMLPYPGLERIAIPGPRSGMRYQNI